MTITPKDILDFWTKDVGAERWFNGGPELDAQITQRFRGVWEAARHGELSGWEDNAEGALALIIVVDQFPRNMFRDHADAFVTDAQALAAARRALAKCLDRAVPENLRAFFYMPFMHSENIADQDESVALFAERLGKESHNYPYALKHRAAIARFGRFPSRNEALGRPSTVEERDFLADNSAKI